MTLTYVTDIEGFWTLQIVYLNFYAKSHIMGSNFRKRQLFSLGH